jgi:hypothetical protein
MSPISVTRALTLLPLLVGLAGCGGSTGDDPDPLTARAVAYRLTGGEEALNLGDTDRALAAALAAISAANSLDAGGLLEIDEGFSPPGSGRQDCPDGGSLLETIANGSGGARTYLLDADQCYARDSSGEILLDGLVILDSVSGGGVLSGTAGLGRGRDAPLIGMLREAGAPEYDFEQVSADVNFSGDLDTSPMESRAVSARIVVGVGTPLRNGDPFTPDRGFEVLAGTSGSNFRVVSSIAGPNTRALTLSGPLSVDGVDLNLECDFSARLTVSTDDAVEVGDDQVPRNGTLRIRPGDGSGSSEAVVDFLADGSANVSVPGASASYSAFEVRNLCGL